MTTRYQIPLTPCLYILDIIKVLLSGKSLRLLRNLLHLHDELPMLGQHLLPASVQLAEWLRLIVGLPDPCVVLVQGMPILEPPLRGTLVEGASVLDEVAGDGDLSHAAFEPARAIFRGMLVRRNPTDNTDICLYAARTICGMVAY